MMSWIRIETSLPRSSKMVQLARALGCNRMAALGVAVTWLAWLDEQTVDGRTGMCAEEVDDVLGFKRAGAALVSIGWAELDEHGSLVAVDWEQYNGESAKKRALSARRMDRKRLRESYAESYAASVTNALPREEKIREEENTYSERHTEYTSDTSGEAPEGPRAVPTIDEVMAVMNALPRANLKGVKLRECAEKWLDTMRSAGWKDTRNRIVHDWAANARNWARSYAETLAKQKLQKGAYTAPKNMNDSSEYGTY